MFYKNIIFAVVVACVVTRGLVAVTARVKKPKSVPSPVSPTRTMPPVSPINGSHAQ